MKKGLLLPSYFKIIGWFFLVPSFVHGILWLCNFRMDIQSPVLVLWDYDGHSSASFFTIIYKNIYNEIVAVPLLISLIMVAFAKEKNEDEYISKLRLDAFIWSVYVNFFLLLLSTVFVFREAFYTVMIFNMFTILLFFIIKFNISLYKSGKQNEEQD